MRRRIVTMNISLPQSMRDFVRKRTEDGEFANASEYIRHLIRSEQVGPSSARLERLLQEGLDSGHPVEVTPEFWRRMRKRVADRVAQTRGRRRKAG